jgi:hypothetical protein
MYVKRKTKTGKTNLPILLLRKFITDNFVVIPTIVTKIKKQKNIK